MTRIEWKTNHKSQRGLHLRESLKALSVSRSYKRNISAIARVACDSCPFRSNCDLDTSRGRPYGHLAVILTRGSQPKYPDAEKNRRRFRANLDNPDINVERTPCADLLLNPGDLKRIKFQANIVGSVPPKQEALPGVDPGEGGRKVMLDFPRIATFDRPPSQEETDALIASLNK